MSSLLGRIDRWLSAVEFVATGGLIVLALAIGTVQVVLRYVFNMGYPWSEEAFMLCTITAMLFAGSRAVREDKHVRVELLPLLVSPPMRRVLRIAAHFVTLALCAYFAYAGLLYVAFAYSIDTVSPASGIPDWVVYSLVPLSMGLFVVRYVMRLVLALRGEDIETAHGLPAETLAELEGRAS
ncbi:MAG: TRAP transporter small permease [Variibacter sp.]|nr:TRAP transporter small permease [Variibacter sp.]